MRDEAWHRARLADLEAGTAELLDKVKINQGAMLILREALKDEDALSVDQLEAMLPDGSKVIGVE